MTAFEAWASQVGQIGNGARDPSPTFTGLVAPRSGMGHRPALRLTEASGRCRFGQGTVVGTQGNGQGAPVSDVRPSRRYRQPLPVGRDANARQEIDRGGGPRTD